MKPEFRKHRKAIWLVWGVVLLCYVIPYTLLSDVARWYGSFLFWACAGVAVIVLNVLLTQGFKEHGDD